uniref:NADH-ubiquinone oxidoreductase chain 3 n=1 Tax=Oxyuris equi TaxID=132389 RepID=A0A0G2T6X4_9BILA|nr:NADH dehydrogenase subunit 3 [Oxyuris equi]AKI07547.1 NADH dehydrogenase subunit 3 [Oxyuris equi]
MFVLSVVIVVSFVLILVLYGGMFVMSIKDSSVYKVFSFESGFMSVGKIQGAFSIHFFVMMLIFVIFDLEVVMLLGLIVSDLSMWWSFVVVFFFVSGGFVMEWLYCKLVWLV